MSKHIVAPWLQCALFGVAEGLIFLSYQHSDGRFHWFLHFFVGATAALTLLAAHALWSRRLLRWPLLWLLIGHLVAMIPDFLFGIMPHQPWMNVFLMHIAVHFVPGRNWAWYTIFLISLAVYLAARWSLEARRAAATGRERSRNVSSHEH